MRLLSLECRRKLWNKNNVQFTIPQNHIILTDEKLSINILTPQLDCFESTNFQNTSQNMFTPLHFTPLSENIALVLSTAGDASQCLCL